MRPRGRPRSTPKDFQPIIGSCGWRGWPIVVSIAAKIHCLPAPQAHDRPSWEIKDTLGRAALFALPTPR